MSQRIRLLLMVGLVATSLVVGGLSIAPSALASTGADAVLPPDQDPFYQLPAALPTGPPGTIIRSRPVQVKALLVVPVPVQAWQVLHLSTSAQGKATAVSGTVLVPNSPWTGAGARPVVGYAVGTHGLGDQCAPSYRLRIGTEVEWAAFGQALLRGWAVAVTDYEGLGTSGPHTYTSGEAEGHALLDLVRAATRLPAAGLSAKAPVGLWGYSQGGQASAWAGELAATYAPELRVRGVAAGGVPADLAKAAQWVDGGPAAGIVFAAAIGLAATYSDVPFESVLTETGKSAAATARKSCIAEIALQLPFRRLTDFVTLPDPLNHPRWKARLAENRAGQVAPKAPVLLYHGTFDELIPFTLGEQLRADYCSRGAAVDWKPMHLVGHITGLTLAAPMVTDWLSHRFTGSPPPNTCP